MAEVSISEALTLWAAPHPNWEPIPDWPEDVGFVTRDSADAYVFIDPLIRDDLEARAWAPLDAASSRPRVRAVAAR